MAESTLVQKAYTTVIKHFIRTGRAPHYTELAETLGLQPDEARDVQREAAEAAVACWFVKDTDYIESWALVFSGPLARNRLEPDYLSRVQEYKSELFLALQKLGRTGPFWQPK